jgi:hypothetical protein
MRERDVEDLYRKGQGKKRDSITAVQSKEENQVE